MDALKIAVLSDIHGNRWALEAVLADIRRRDILRMVNLGDSFYGPLDPRGTADLLLPLDLPTVRGNEDRILFAPGPAPEANALAATVRTQLRTEHLRWLESLPLTDLLQRDLRLCHGTPYRDDEYLLVRVTGSGVRVKGPGELQDQLAGMASPVLLCGHDHIPRDIRLPDGRSVFNPGSVGCPAYADDDPVPHTLAAGTPHARYGIVSRMGGGWRMEQVAVPYDWERAASVAERNGRSDWAGWLRTGSA